MKIFTRLFFTVLILSAFQVHNFAQCPLAGTLYGSATAPTNSGVVAYASPTCHYTSSSTGDYAAFTGLTAGSTYLIITSASSSTTPNTDELTVYLSTNTTTGSHVAYGTGGQVTFVPTVSGTYYLVINKATAACGTAESVCRYPSIQCTSCPPVPVVPAMNNAICSAPLVTSFTNGTRVATYTTAGATVEVGEANPVGFQGGSAASTRANFGWSTITAPTNTVWLAFTVPVSSSGNLSIRTTVGDNQLALWKFSDACTFAGAQLLQANDDALSGSGLNSVLRARLNPGDTYYVQIDPYTSGSTVAGDIFIEDLNSTPVATGYTANPANGGMGGFYDNTSTGMHAAYEVNSDHANDRGWTFYYANNSTTTNNLGDDPILFAINRGTEWVGHIRRSCTSTTAPTLNSYATSADSFQVFLGNVAGSTTTNLTATAPYLPGIGYSTWGVMNRFWNVQPAKQLSSAVQIRFFYDDADFTNVQTLANSIGGSVASHTDLKMYKATKSTTSHYTNTELNPTGGQAAITNTTVTLPAWTYTASPFGAAGWHQAEWSVSTFSGGGGGGGAALYVSLSKFNAQEQGSVNHLTWQTSSEVNSKEFVVERSVNGTSNWTNIGTVIAKGNSSSVLDYTFTDARPLVASYYRLKMVDLDNSSTYSKTVNIIRKRNANGIVSVFPVPANTAVTVQYESIETGEVKMTITDITGRIVDTREVSLSQGINALQVNLSERAKGIYFVKIVQDGAESIEKLIKE